jgi:hypothetical protein
MFLPRTFYRSGWLRCVVRIWVVFEFWPRTFYRSGWLRCDVFICVVLVWAGGRILVFRAGGAYLCGVCVIIYYILYYTIHIILYIIHILLLYTIIIYYTLLFFYSLLLFLFCSSPILPFPSSFLISSILLSHLIYLLLFFPISSPNHSRNTCRYLHILIYILSFQYPHLIHSILVGTYIYLFIFFPIKYLTPHVLSEWMVEVWCGDLYRFGF